MSMLTVSCHSPFSNHDFRTETIRFTCVMHMRMSWCFAMHDYSFRPQSAPCLPPSCCPDNHLPVTTPKPMLILLTGIILHPVIYRLFVMSAASGAYKQWNSPFSILGCESTQRSGDHALKRTIWTKTLQCSWFPLRCYRWGCMFFSPAIIHQGNCGPCIWYTADSPLSIVVKCINII